MKQQNKFIKIYNNLCRVCKHKVSGRPEMLKEEYCLKNNTIIKNVFDFVIRTERKNESDIPRIKERIISFKLLIILRIKIIEDTS